MKTKPIYLDDPYVKKMRAAIIDSAPEKEGVWRLILDQTIFYPMGGGQPTDQGTLIFSDGSQGEVYQVLLKEGEINHYVKTPLQPGLPKNKPLRALKLEGVGLVADGGTIVSSTEEVGKVLITDIEVVDGNTCIKYQVT